MNDQVTSTVTVADWEEHVFDESDDGPRITRASFVKHYEGRLRGKGVVLQIATYTSAGHAVFSAMERFHGAIADKEGAFVLKHEGAFDAGTVSSTWTIVPGTGSGDLRDLSGSVDFEASHGQSYPIVLNLRSE